MPLRIYPVGALLAAEGITDAPLISDFDPGVPGAGLVDFWRRGVGLTLDDAGRVISWRGFNGTMAQQPDPARRPLATADGISFDGSTWLVTPVVPDPVAGYIVAKVKRGPIVSTSTAALILGEHQRIVPPAARLSLGFATSDGVTAWLGDSSPQGFTGTTPVGAGETATIGLGWDEGAGRLRLNGAQEAARAYDGETGGEEAGVGSRALWLGGVNQFNGFASPSDDTLTDLAIYAGPSDDAARAAIDAAVAAAA
jgi:hypothetical protein